MAYTKTTWASKDIITASKLNHLEDGVAAASAAADDVNSSLEEESSKLSQKIQTNVDNITQLSSRITTAENDIVGLNNDINDLENEDSTINDRIDNIDIFTGNEANPATTSLTKKIDDLTSSTTISLSNQDTKLTTLASQIAGLSTGSVNYKGTYTNGTSYVKNDIVSYSITSEGITTITYYICISNNVTGTSGAPTEPDWQVFIMPTQLDGLVYYGATEPGTDNEAQFWVKTKTTGEIDSTQIVVMTKDDINNIYVKDYTEKTYNVGDIVYHNDKLYICKTAITTAEIWNSAHWNETLVANEFINLANNIVKVSNVQPSDMFNKVWIDSETESEQVPTYEEFQELESDVDDLKSALDDMQDEIDNFEGISDDVKTALLACFANVAWINDQGQSYYDALESALNPKTLTSISAVFNQGQNVIYSTDSLETLRQYLTVTAHYMDSTTAVILGYTLSGTLSIGTSTITVTYEDKTATFNVAVTQSPIIYNWSASSGVNPPDMTATSFDFNEEPGAVKVIVPNLQVPIASDNWEAEIECKITYWESANNPKISLNGYTSDTDNLNIVLQPNASSSSQSDLTKLAYVYNWNTSTKTFTNYTYDVYRKYHVTYSQGMFNVYIDNTQIINTGKIDSSKHVEANAFRIVCAQESTGVPMYIKTIKIMAY